MRIYASKVQLPSECRISHSSQSTYFDAVALIQRVLHRTTVQPIDFPAPYLGELNENFRRGPRLGYPDRDSRRR